MDSSHCGALRDARSSRDERHTAPPKGGMVRLTEAMAMDHAKDKIRVNCICPGTDADANGRYTRPRKSLRATKPECRIGRIGEPEDVAYAALYLASDEASMVTAAILAGGRRHAADGPSEIESRLFEARDVRMTTKTGWNARRKAA